MFTVVISLHKLGLRYDRDYGAARDRTNNLPQLGATSRLARVFIFFDKGTCPVYMLQVKHTHTHVVLIPADRYGASQRCPKNKTEKPHTPPPPPIPPPEVWFHFATEQVFLVCVCERERERERERGRWGCRYCSTPFQKVRGLDVFGFKHTL